LKHCEWRWEKKKVHVHAFPNTSIDYNTRFFVPLICIQFAKPGRKTEHYNPKKNGNKD